MTPYQVYVHRGPAGNIVYVGQGTLDRPWQVRNRSKEHSNWLINLCKVGWPLTNSVEVVSFHETKGSAIQEELSLIDRYRPQFNKNYDNKIPTVLNKERFVKAKSLRNKGSSYETIAKELNVSTMAIHRALNGKVKAYDKWS